ncbi:MAG: NUDIX hydrolase [Acidimicrobiia bacterium]
MKTTTATSAGGLIVDDQGRVVLTARRSFKGDLQWGLPKGLVEPGEEPEAAALREAREETGFEVEMVRPLSTIDYWFVQPARPGQPAARIHKFVHYFLMTQTGGDPSLHDSETEEVAVLDPNEALERVTFKNERSVIQQAIQEAT